MNLQVWVIDLSDHLHSFRDRVNKISLFRRQRLNTQGNTPLAGLIQNGAEQLLCPLPRPLSGLSIQQASLLWRAYYQYLSAQVTAQIYEGIQVIPCFAPHGIVRSSYMQTIRTDEEPMQADGLQAVVFDDLSDLLSLLCCDVLCRTGNGKWSYFNSLVSQSARNRADLGHRPSFEHFITQGKSHQTFSGTTNGSR